MPPSQNPEEEVIELPDASAGRGRLRAPADAWGPVSCAVALSASIIGFFIYFSLFFEHMYLDIVSNCRPPLIMKRKRSRGRRCETGRIYAVSGIRVY